MGALAVLDVLDRDGQVRETIRVADWPCSVGRALDNDVVLSDPHLAPHHLRIECSEHTLVIEVGECINGVSMGMRRWRAGERIELAADGVVPEFVAGRTRLRLRLAGHALPAELPIAAAPTASRRTGLMLGATVLVLAGLSFGTYLDTDPDGLGRGLAGVLLASVAAAALWCGLWALLSKTFTRRGRFGWHLRVFLLASLALMVVDAVPKLVAFAFSWPAIDNYAFVASFGVGASALYFHLLAVEPARPRLMRWVALTTWVVGVTLTFWFNQQRNDHFGEELYMSHLFLPGMRLVKPVSIDSFVGSAQSLQAVLDKKAKEPPFGGSGARDEE
ncbi:MAG: FHA domain-containing protein [Rhizobacter sp.]|nr:FHA domain-containing protein [Rhizobacter sp.]